jgi:hypothetical protein
MASNMADDKFWEARPTLIHVRDFARARRVGPWGTLGSVLVNTIATVPPAVVLEPLVGGDGSLNLLVALVGDSARGKGACQAAASEGVTFFSRKNGNDLVPPPTPLGSGEGLAATYIGPRVRKRRDPDKPEQETIDEPPMKCTTAVFESPEIDSLSGLMYRQGSLLSAELRKLFSGEALGQGNAGEQTRRIVPRHGYRACVVCGVQPLRSRALLAAADGGLPQRFLWLPVDDPDAPDERPERPMPEVHSDLGWPVASRIEVALPDEARDEIEAFRLRVLRGDTTLNPLAGHELLVREKVAVGLAVLSDRRHVKTEDWWLAGYLIEVSNRTREMCIRSLAEHASRERYAKAMDVAERDTIVADSKFGQAKRAILRWLDRQGEPMPHSDLRRKLKYQVRLEFDAAIAELIEEGQVSKVTAEHGFAYCRYTPVHPGTPPLSSDDVGCTEGCTGTPRGSDSDAPPAETPPTEAGTTTKPSRASKRRDRPRNGAEISAPLCTSCNERPAGPRGWCQPCGDAYGMSS